MRLKEAQKGSSQPSKDGLPPILPNTWPHGSWGSFLGYCPSGQVGQEDKPTPVASDSPLGSWDQVGVGMVWGGEECVKWVKGEGGCPAEGFA